MGFDENLVGGFGSGSGNSTSVAVEKVKLKKPPVEKNKKVFSIVRDVIRKNIGRKEEVQPLSYETYYARASRVSGLNVVEEVNAVLNGTVRTDKPAPATDMAYTIGSAVHEYMRLDSYCFGQALIGRWRCRGCGKLHGTIIEPIPMPLSCECNIVAEQFFRHEEESKFLIDNGFSLEAIENILGIENDKRKKEGKPRFTMEYVEPWAFDTEYRIGGHNDGFVLECDKKGVIIEGGKRIINDLKTARDGSYRRLDEYGIPIYYIIQINVYMWLFKVPRGRIVYVNKDTGSMAEFDIFYSEFIIEEMKKRLSYLKNCLKENKLLPGGDELIPMSDLDYGEGKMYERIY